MFNQRGFIKNRNFSFLTLILLATLLNFQNCAKPMKEYTLYGDFASNKPFEVPPTEHPLPLKTIKTDYQLQLSDRNYVAGILADVFGPSAKTILQNNILLRREEMGGPCSEYAHVMVKSGSNFVNQEASLVCNEDGTTKMMVPPPQSVRQGWISQTCAELVGKGATVPDSLNFALNKIQAGRSALALPAPSDGNFLVLHRLFYRERPVPPSAVFESLRVMFDPEVPTLENWRTAIFSYCISSQWQVL